MGGISWKSVLLACKVLKKVIYNEQDYNKKKRVSVINKPIALHIRQNPLRGRESIVRVSVCMCIERETAYLLGSQPKPLLLNLRYKTSTAIDLYV